METKLTSGFSYAISYWVLHLRSDWGLYDTCYSHSTIQEGLFAYSTDFQGLGTSWIVSYMMYTLFFYGIWMTESIMCAFDGILFCGRWGLFCSPLSPELHVEPLLAGVTRNKIGKGGKGLNLVR